MSHHLFDVSKVIISQFNQIATFNNILFNYHSLASMEICGLWRPFLQPPIDTIEEIYNSPFYIYAYHESWTDKATRELTNISGHLNWSDKMRLTKLPILRGEAKTYNNSMCFMEEIDYADMLLRVQKRLNIKGYHKSQVQFSSELMSLVVADDFPFVERVNEIVHRVLSSGMYDVWDRYELSYDENKNLKRNLELLIDREGSGVESFEVPMFIVYGWVASIGVFVVEIIWKRLTLLPMKRFQKNLFARFRRLGKSLKRFAKSCTRSCTRSCAKSLMKVKRFAQRNKRVARKI